MFKRIKMRSLRIDWIRLRVRICYYFRKQWKKGSLKFLTGIYTFKSKGQTRVRIWRKKSVNKYRVPVLQKGPYRHTGIGKYRTKFHASDLCHVTGYGTGVLVSTLCTALASTSKSRTYECVNITSLPIRLVVLRQEPG
jgi:hypothetical protein